MTTLIYAVHSQAKINILRKLGKVNFLISYYILRRQKEEQLVNFLSSVCHDVFMLDSGAYTAWSQGVPISLFGYIDFIKKYHQYFTHIVCLDVIDNPILSEVNHLIMQQELKDFDLTIIPVFHSGESFSVLDYMVEKGYKYLGISPNNNWRETEKRKWLRKVFSRYDFEKRGIKTHGFGYQSVMGLRYFPLTTCDAATWEIAAGYGKVIHPTLGEIRYSDKSTWATEHIDNIGGEDPEFVTTICRDMGISIDDLKKKRNSRVLFNAEALDRLVSINKKLLDYESIELFDGGNEGDFTEKKVLTQLEICIKMGREYKGSFDVALAQKRNRKQKSKEEKLF